MEKAKLYLSTIDPNAQEYARRYGLGLEIAEYCTAMNMDEDFPRTDAAVREKQMGIERLVFHAPFNELFPCAIDPKARALARDRYRQAISLARAYGAKRVVIHGGYQPFMYYPVWYTEQSVPFWKSFLKELPEDTTILLENVLEEQPKMLLDIVEGVDDPRLRLCLDIGHANVYSKVPVLDWLEALAPWISHFHIHNNDGSWDTHSPLNQGNIPIREFLAHAEALCPEATYTLELMESEASVRLLLEGSLWNRN
ncbi:MAG: sugar phosphate isomerase/epimerase family protein [Faecousia sp.]